MDKPGEKFLLGLIEVFLYLFGSATVAYHISLRLYLPAQLIFVPFIVIFGLLAAWSFSRWKEMLQQAIQDRWFISITLCLGLAVGIFTLLVTRRQADDVQHFHRPLLQLQHLDEPFIITENQYGTPKVPLAAVGFLPSYEPILAISAHVLGLDPLHTYHNIAPFLSSIFWVFIYILLYRQFGLDRKTALVASFVVALFLISDGNLHRSFGNAMLMRLWHGKAIMWTLLVPLTLLLSVRYLEKPTTRRWFAVFLVTLAAGGLSATGLFLIPALLIAVGPTYLMTYGFSVPRLKHVALLNCASTYSALLLALMIFDILPNYDLTGLFTGIKPWQTSWSGNVGLVVTDAREWIRNLLILLVLPLLGLAPVHGRFLVTLTIVLGAFYVNPWTGSWLMQLLTPGSYWRLVYLFPLPLCAGLAAACFQWRGVSKRKVWTRVGVLCIIIVASARAIHQTVLTSGTETWGRVWIKSPAEYRFEPEVLAFSKRALEHIGDRRILAPHLVIQVLPLLKPEVTLEATRPFQTFNDFSIVGTPQEGQRRVDAQSLVTRCVRAPELDAAFRHSLENGVDAVIMRDHRDHGDAELAQMYELFRSSGQWVVAERSNGYILLVRRDTTGPVGADARKNKTLQPQPRASRP